jgi:hypothetical protein
LRADVPLARALNQSRAARDGNDRQPTASAGTDRTFDAADLARRRVG